MTQRKPQVGDLYLIKYGGVYSLFLVKVYNGSLACYYLREDISQRNDLYLDIYNLEICDKVYLGKLAPRYKRLFGIYFVRDNNGNTKA